jgi:hypothetical protein
VGCFVNFKLKQQLTGDCKAAVRGMSFWKEHLKMELEDVELKMKHLKESSEDNSALSGFLENQKQLESLEHVRIALVGRLDQMEVEPSSQGSELISAYFKLSLDMQVESNIVQTAVFSQSSSGTLESNLLKEIGSSGANDPETNADIFKRIQDVATMTEIEFLDILQSYTQSPGDHQEALLKLMDIRQQYIRDSAEYGHNAAQAFLVVHLKQGYALSPEQKSRLLETIIARNTSTGDK